MTEHELSEVLAHPRFQAYVQRVASEAAELKLRQLRPFDARAQKPARVVPDGFLTYGDAAEKYNRSQVWVRGLVAREKVAGGQGLVNAASLAVYVRSLARGPQRFPHKSKRTAGIQHQVEEALIHAVQTAELATT